MEVREIKIGMDNKSEINFASYPNVYRISFDDCSFEDIVQVYRDDIFLNCRTKDVEYSLIDYISQVIEPVGWKAAWRATPSSSKLPYECDFIVYVQGVSLQKLEADVRIEKVIHDEGRDNSSIDYSFAKNLLGTCQNAPLIELHTISDEDTEENFSKTAVAIEYVRFFFKYIWRPWDEEDYDDDDDFVEQHLVPRLNFFFDAKNKAVPVTMMSKYATLLKESWDIKCKIDMLNVEMNICDSEADLNEDDIQKQYVLRSRLDEIQKEMEMLENPLIRTIALHKLSPQKSLLKKKRSESGPVTHFVAEQFTYGMFQGIPIDSTVIIEFHSSLQAALLSSCSGDNILIFPGCYKCDTLSWIEDDISIKGFGSPEQVILEAIGNEDIFINCNDSTLSLSNLLIRPVTEMLSAIVVHSGKVNLEQCIIYGNFTKNCIRMLSTSECKLKNSVIKSAQINGISAQANSILSLESSKITLCKGSGLYIENEDKSANITKVQLNNSEISFGSEYGIHIKDIQNIDPAENLKESLEVISATELKQRVKWLNISLENTSFVENKKGEICFESVLAEESMMP